MSRLEEIDSEIKELSNQIEELRGKQHNLSAEREKIQADANAKEVLDFYDLIDDSNSISVRLYNDTKTTPIMDEFSTFKYLILKGFFQYLAPYWIFDLVISHYKYNTSCIKTNLTMTKLKQGLWSDTPLKGAISKVDIPKAIENGYASFETPIKFGGQTSANQTGFGDIYNGEELVEEGTKYGDTTAYFAIGVLARKRFG